MEVPLLGVQNALSAPAHMRTHAHARTHARTHAEENHVAQRNTTTKCARTATRHPQFSLAAMTPSVLAHPPSRQGTGPASASSPQINQTQQCSSTASRFVNSRQPGVIRCPSTGHVKSASKDCACGGTNGHDAVCGTHARLNPHCLN